MAQYSISSLESHWLANQHRFRTEFDACRKVFAELISAISDIGSLLSGHKTLEANCAYLLTVKATNHIASTLLLMERGLMVDGALTSRSALETLLLLELLAKKPELCKKWSAGEQFTPGSVRKTLVSLSKVEAGDFAIEVSVDTYDDARFAYDWLSRITHANLDSLNYTTAQSGENSFELHIGGALSPPMVVAITRSLGWAAFRTMATCLAVHDPKGLQAMSGQLQRVASLSNSLGKETV
jgi:hypothetical protein